MRSNLEGVKVINDYLNRWLIDNHFDCTVKFGTDFSYDYLNDIITYSFMVADTFDKEFIKVCKFCREEINTADTFILSFFHELGHFETQAIFTDAEWKNYDKLCKKLSKKKKPKIKDYKKYWYHPVELEATRWACDYIVNNKEKIDIW